MAGFDYSEMAQTALEMLQEFGTEAFIVRNDTSTSTPWDPQAGSPIEYPCTVVMTYYSDALLGGTSIKQGDKKIILAAADLPIVPQTTDKINVDGETFVIVNVKKIAPARTPLVYEIQARL